MPLDFELDSEALIRTLGMAPHPEAGWYTETFRAPSEPGTRSAVTAIYFLLREGERSHWHRVDASEIWLWHASSPIFCGRKNYQRRNTHR
jgi:predicted cupin superfamily sugar epimerase